MSSTVPRKSRAKGKAAIIHPAPDLPAEPVCDSVSAPLKVKAHPKPQAMTAAQAAAAAAAEAEAEAQERTLGQPPAKRAAARPRTKAKRPSVPLKKALPIPDPPVDDGADSAHASEDLEPAPSPRHLRARKAPIPATHPKDAAPSQQKPPSKKELAALVRQAKLEKEEVRKKSIQALAAYEKTVIAWGFEKTPLPPPPPAVAASGSSKIPGIFGLGTDVGEAPDDAMEVDEEDEFGLAEFHAQVAEMEDDPEADDDSSEVFRFRLPKQAEVKEEEEEDEGPLYRMEGLTSEADMILTSPLNASNDFVLPSDEEEGSSSSDEDAFEVEDTPVARKVVRKVAAGVNNGKKAQTVEKGKGREKIGKVVAKAKAGAVKSGQMSVPTVRKLTKGSLLRDQITVLRDDPAGDRGTAASGLGTAAPHGLTANSGQVDVS